MQASNLRELLSDLSLAIGQSVYFIDCNRIHALQFCANAANLPCAACAHRDGKSVCASILALDGLEEETSCRGGFPVLAVPIDVRKERIGALAAGPVRSASQAYLRALQSMLRACASLVLEQRLFPEQHGLFDELSSYISEHIADPLSARTLQSVFFLSADSLSRLTLRETGLPLQRFIRVKRLEAARTLLLATNLNVQEIAERCGVSDFNYFSRIFKKHYGCTPSEMRRRGG